jgi:hypothetical protein
MGGATVAVAAIWFLVDQKFQKPGASLPNNPALQNELAGDATEPTLDELLKAKEPLPPVDPLANTLPKDGKPPTLTLQKPGDGTAVLENGAMQKKLPTPSRVSPVILPPSTTSSAPSEIPSLKPQQPATSTQRSALSTPTSLERPGALLPNLPDPMERFNSYSAPVQSEPPVSRPQQPAEKNPAPAPAPVQPETPADASEDSIDQPAQMPELFTSDPDKS